MANQRIYCYLHNKVGYRFVKVGKPLGLAGL